MKSGFPLSTKIFLLAFLNLVLLSGVFFVFARVEFRFDLRSFLLTPARDRIMSVSRLIALELPSEPPAEWNRTLTRYSSNYPAEFYVFAQGGEQLAGNPVQLPNDVMHVATHEPFAPMTARTSAALRQEPPPGGHEDPGGPVFLTESQHPHQYWALVHVPIWTEFGKEPGHGMVIWRIQSLLSNAFYFDYKPWVATILAVIAISVLCWLPFIRGLTRSIGQLTRATGRIADGQFDVAVPVRRSDELGRLSLSIRRMALRLSEFVNGQRRFLGDVAHELCSPIARIQVAIGILEQRANEPDAEYVEIVRQEMDHMSALVNELLSFSKTQIGARVQLGSVNVAETVARVLQREQTDSVDVRADINGELAVVAEPEYLFRSLANVVRNAVRYAGEAGPVTISAKNGDGQVTITVADSGPGVPESELDKIFKPFYRPDEARQHETGGTGLGLAIVKSCVEACGGSVRCRNLRPSGLAVDIRLAAV